MSNNYLWFRATNMIQCTSFKAAYQLCRQMYRHQFYCESEITISNTRIIQLHKCNTDIILYVYNEVREPITNNVVSYDDFVKSMQRRINHE